MLVSGAGGCGVVRDTEDVKALPEAAAKFEIEAPCAPNAANALVERAGEPMELEVTAASERPGDPWVLSRGPRLVDVPLFYRVDVLPGGSSDSAIIRVFAVPKSRMVGDTRETVSKPALLAMRIVAECAAGGAK